MNGALFSEELAYGERSVRILAELHSYGFILRMNSTTGRRVFLRLSVKRGVRSVGPERFEVGHWNLLSDANPEFFGGRIWGQVANFAMNELAGSATIDAFSEIHFRHDIYNMMNALAEHAVSCTNPIPRSVALRFRERYRLKVYRRLLADESGRIAELALCCPGVFIFALEMEQVGHVSVRCMQAARLFFDEVAQGKRLGPILDRMLSVWAESFQDFVVAWKLCLFRQEARMSAEELKPLVVNKKKLLRRAGHLVRAGYILRPPPPSFAVEDIPTDLVDNSKWFDVMAGGYDGSRDRNDRRVRALWMFLSKYAVQLRGVFGPESYASEYQVLQMADYVREGRIPSRRTNPFIFHYEVGAWHGRMMIHEFGLDSGDLEAPFIHLGLDTDREGFSIQQITNARELVNEGNEMRHCVGTRINSAAAGDHAYFVARFGGERLTVELSVDRSGYFLSEVRGWRNAPPTKAAAAIIQAWIREVNKDKPLRHLLR